MTSATHAARSKSEILFDVTWSVLHVLAVTLKLSARATWRFLVWAFTDRLPSRNEELRDGWFEDHVDISDEVKALEREHRRALGPMIFGVAAVAALIIIGMTMVASAPGIGEDDPNVKPVDTGETAIVVEAPGIWGL